LLQQKLILRRSNFLVLSFWRLEKFPTAGRVVFTLENHHELACESLAEKAQIPFFHPSPGFLPQPI